MKNFEKYEKEIKEEIEKDGNLYTLAARLSCSNIVEGYELTKWLYEEYEESPLTNGEREYLKVVIKPYRDCINYIYKSIEADRIYAQYNTKTIKPRCYLNIIMIYEVIVLPISETSFINLEPNRNYSVEELGL